MPTQLMCGATSLEMQSGHHHTPSCCQRRLPKEHARNPDAYMHSRNHTHHSAQSVKRCLEHKEKADGGERNGEMVSSVASPPLSCALLPPLTLAMRCLNALAHEDVVMRTKEQHLHTKNEGHGVQYGVGQGVGHGVGHGAGHVVGHGSIAHADSDGCFQQGSKRPTPRSPLAQCVGSKEQR